MTETIRASSKSFNWPSYFGDDQHVTCLQMTMSTKWWQYLTWSFASG